MCALETLTQMFISCPRDTLELLVKKKMLNQTKLYETEIGKPSLILKKIVLLDSFFELILVFSTKHSHILSICFTPIFVNEFLFMLLFFLF